MAKSRTNRAKVYLAGPIAGCNDAQRDGWRGEIKSRWSKQFEFIDPDRTGAASDETEYALVKRDLQGIEQSDAVLANMWRESIGTAMGIVHARNKDRIVVVADPNRIQSRILVFYADAIERSPAQAMKTLRNLLRAQERLGMVIKRNGKPERFSREKLAESVRKSCRGAGRDDLLAPATIVPRVVAELCEKAGGKGEILSGKIKDTVWKVLKELEADPLRTEDLAGIREAWESYEQTAGGRGPLLHLVRRPEQDEIRIHRAPGRVAVQSHKSHATIWGKAVKQLADIPQPARAIFTRIACVEGVTSIRFGRFQRGEASRDPHVQLFASRSPAIIEGKCFHHAPKGQIQTFQVRVQRPEQTDAIRKCLISHLHGRDMLRAAPEDADA